MQLPLTGHASWTSRSQGLRARLLPLYIAAFSQGLVLWAPIEKVFLRGLGFGQAALGLMAACYSSLIYFLKRREKPFLLSPLGPFLSSKALYIQIRIARVAFDKALAGRYLVAHEHRKDLIGLDGLLD